MSLIKYTITFLAGVYVGQEFGKTIPNVKEYSKELYESFSNTAFYKKIKDDWRKN
jgi:hypothetical protein